MINLMSEANHCLLCKKPKCQTNCPINTPIPKIIELYKEGKLEEAGKILFNNNPLTSVCAIVCPHEDQCRGNCIRGIKGEPVHFHSIEEEISLKYLENMKLEIPKSNGIKVAIIGSGPAGITVAFELARKGYDITIFEKNDKIGGILNYGIPSFRLSRSYIDHFERHLRSLNVKIKINSMVGPIVTLDKLFEDGYKSIFIGTGVWNPKSLGVKGETLGHVHYAIDYLRSPQNYSLGNNVLVIGAGNVAMDAARSAKYYGSETVEVVYRRDFDNMTATKQEIHEAIDEGVLFKTFETPVEIVDNGILLSKTKNVVNEDGTTTLVNIPNSEYVYKCNSILIAVSQVPRNTIVLNNAGLDTVRGGHLAIDSDGHTTRPGVFACGDVTHGAKTVIEAVVASKQVADSMDKFLQNIK